MRLLYIRSEQDFRFGGIKQKKKGERKKKDRKQNSEAVSW
jgi:hypothetical protein